MKLNEQKNYFEKEYLKTIEILQNQLKSEGEDRERERELNNKKREKIEIKLKQLQKRIEAEENEGSEQIFDSINDILQSNSKSITDIQSPINNQYMNKKDGKTTRLEMKRKLNLLEQVN